MRTTTSMVAVEDYTEAFAAYGGQLAEGITAAVPGWVVRCVTTTMESVPAVVTPEVTADAEAAGREAQRLVGNEIRMLLTRDIDGQWTTPLTIVRNGAVPYPTGVLRRAGVSPVERDALEVELAPDDDYDLWPRSLADLDPALSELAVHWGAAKAWVHRARHGG
ncbi:MAG: hypothetical protein ACRDZY_03075 [Acidimicrobiales bacterium]